MPSFLGMCTVPTPSTAADCIQLGEERRTQQSPTPGHSAAWRRCLRWMKGRGFQGKRSLGQRESNVTVSTRPKTLHVVRPPLKSFPHSEHKLESIRRARFPIITCRLDIVKSSSWNLRTWLYSPRVNCLDLSYPRLDYKMSFFLHPEPQPRRHLYPQPFQYLPSAISPSPEQYGIYIVGFCI